MATFALATTIVFGMTMFFSHIKIKNGFLRKFPENKTLQQIATSKLNTSYDNIVGVSEHTIYLSNFIPNRITALSKHTLESLERPMRWDKLSDYSEIKIDSPIAFIFNGNNHWISIQDVNEPLKDSPLHNINLFTNLAIISNSSIIVRSHDSSLNSVFKKISLRNDSVLTTNPILPEKNRELIQTDGILTYDKITSRLFYAQYYQNRFFCLDTNLNLLYTAKTIDTTNTNLMWVRKSSSGSVQSGIPPKEINASFTTNGKYIFIRSSLTADNEDATISEENDVIDVYLSQSGAYVTSYYLPKVNKEKAIQIKAEENMLIALYKTAISLYKINI